MLYGRFFAVFVFMVLNLKNFCVSEFFILLQRSVTVMRILVQTGENVPSVKIPLLVSAHQNGVANHAPDVSLTILFSFYPILPISASLTHASSIIVIKVHDVEKVDRLLKKILFYCFNFSFFLNMINILQERCRYALVNLVKTVVYASGQEILMIAPVGRDLLESNAKKVSAFFYNLLF